MTVHYEWIEALGYRLCAIWNIPPDQCTGIDVHWRPHEYPTATVHLLVNEGIIHELLTLAPIARTPQATHTCLCAPESDEHG